MPQDQSLTTPSVSVSKTALGGVAQEPAAPVVSSEKPLTAKDRIANFAKESIENPEAVPTPVSRQAVHPTHADPAAPIVTGEPKAAPAGAGEPPNYKVLKDALAAKDVKLLELQTELEKVKPSAERATALEAELATKQKSFDEVNEFRAKTGLLNSDVFHNTITVPRTNLAAMMKAEFKADGLKEELWDDALSTIGNRPQLEAFAKEHITSDLLRNQFYDAFFKDSALRQQEAAALAAPQKYLEDFKAGETAHRSQLKEIASRNFDATVTQAMQDATAMMSKLGEHRLVELTELADNPEHNNKVVKPLLAQAHAGATAMLKERLELGLPVTREDAARTIYLWRNSVAALAVGMDRMKWYNEAQRLEEQVVKLQEKLEIKTARNNPTPGGREASPVPNGTMSIPGNTVKERLANAAQMSKDGKL